MVFMNFSSTCPLYPNSPERCEVIIAIKRGFAGFSLICCIFLAFIIYLFKKYEDFAQKMILMLTISAFFDCITYIAGDIYEEGGLCTAQAFFMSYFDWSTLLWVCCISFNLWLIVIKRIRKSAYFWKYNAVCWVVPFILSLAPFIGNNYGPAGVWCWIGDSSPYWRLGIWYIPLYFLVLVMLGINSFIVLRVWYKGDEWDGAFDASEERNKAQLKDEIKQLLAYPLIYLVLSIPPLIFRIYGGLHSEEETNYGLIIATVIAGPSQGALNAIAFATDRETFKRFTPSQIAKAFRTHGASSAAHVIHNYEVDDTTAITQYDSVSSRHSSSTDK